MPAVQGALAVVLNTYRVADVGPSHNNWAQFLGRKKQPVEALRTG